ncbi:MAG: hypothetical protein UY28_C0010G0018 [Candidatus Amesbacteria bacterium GW2011_GWB1_48_13]|uniref:Uncharacterized protein n=1 Tax=Candidatus Amesbacteria bacterium GW2011_GWB1_48_13 TaxID=1618362 RepID=A0A0G1X5S8_9BACT|nr:MAG: hypothetical protein UY28_C0010G0018 [Candidatus Amesbacteria bacterium GW2011_GWB1_48_13]
MSRVHKVLLGIYLASLFLLLIVLGLVSQIFKFSLLKILAFFLIIPVSLGIFFLPFFLIWNEENALSDRLRLITSIIYAVLMVILFSVFVIRYLETPRSLSENTLSAVILFPDESGRRHRLSITNNSDINLFRCSYRITSQGDREIWQAFSKNYSLEDCARGAPVKDFLDCRLGNWVNKHFRYQKAIDWGDLHAGTPVEIPLENFFRGQTRPNLQYLSSKSPQDIFDLTAFCRLSDGTPVYSEIFFTPSDIPSSLPD